MKLITIISMVLFSLFLTYPVYALDNQATLSQATEGLHAPIVICLDQTLSKEFVDVSLSPVYDWVHAGQQGVKFTVTNKTHENMVIDWDRALYLWRNAGETFEAKNAPSMETGSMDLSNVLPPGATLSKTMWPSSSASKAEWFSKPGRLKNRSAYLTFSAGKGLDKHEEIMLDVSGQDKFCRG